jgi:hypothetical protein
MFWRENVCGCVCVGMYVCECLVPVVRLTWLAQWKSARLLIVWSWVRSPHRVKGNVLYSVCTIFWDLYFVRSAIYCLLYILLHCTLYIVHCTFLSAYYTPDILHHIMNSIICNLQFAICFACTQLKNILCTLQRFVYCCSTLYFTNS